VPPLSMKIRFKSCTSGIRPALDARFTAVKYRKLKLGNIRAALPKDLNMKMYGLSALTVKILILEPSSKLNICATIMAWTAFQQVTLLVF